MVPDPSSDASDGPDSPPDAPDSSNSSEESSTTDGSETSAEDREDTATTEDSNAATAVEDDDTTTAVEDDDATMTTVGPANVPAEEGHPPGIDALDERLPEATVDSRWWYWIAAVPVYFVLSTVAGVLAFVLVLFGIAIDLAGPVSLLFVGLFVLLAIPGMVLTVLFPLATYIDARAVATADLEWTPDPVLYGLVAVAAVWITAFTLSVPLAVYYLYKRHRHVGTP